jgi:membrane protease YdiL (CAAX protease family)
VSVESLSPGLVQDVETLRGLYREEGTATADAAAQQALVQRHGYFGRVALAYGVAPSMEPRRSLQESANRFSVRIVAIAMGIVMLAAASLLLFVVAAVLLAQGRILRRYRPDPSANSAFLESFALYMLLFFLVLGPVRRYLGLTGLGWEWVGFSILAVVHLWVAWRGSGAIETRKAFGWYAGNGWFREIGAGICGYLAGLPILVAGVMITFLLAQGTGTTAGHPVVHYLEGGASHIFLLFLTVSFYAPIVEETMFRGALFHHLRRRWGWLMTAAIASVIFAMLHPQGLAAIPALGANGIVLCGLREWRGSLIAPIAGHAFNNFLAITVALLVLGGG